MYIMSVCLRLEGTEEKLRNRESRPEDLHIIAELREMVTEREALVKKLVVSSLDGVFKKQHAVSVNTKYKHSNQIYRFSLLQFQ